MPEGGKIIVPELDDGGLAQLAGINAIRAMSAAMESMERRLEAQTEKLQELHTDVRVMREQNKQIEELKEQMAIVLGRCQALETRNTLQDGAVKSVDFLAKYAPWLLAVLAFLWGLFGHAPSR